MKHSTDKSPDTRPHPSDFDAQAYWQATGANQLSDAGINLTDQQVRRAVKGLMRLSHALNTLAGTDATAFGRLAQLEPSAWDRTCRDAQAEFNVMLKTCR